VAAGLTTALVTSGAGVAPMTALVMTLAVAMDRPVSRPAAGRRTIIADAAVGGVVAATTRPEAACAAWTTARAAQGPEQARMCVGRIVVPIVARTAGPIAGSPEL
jgi:hypothetical protein